MHSLQRPFAASMAHAMPPPAWFTLRAKNLDDLRASMRHVLAGSAWREPDTVLRDSAIAREGLLETAKLTTAALGALDAHARRAGLGGVSGIARGTSQTPMPQPQPVPAPPKTHRLLDLAMFGRHCLPLLDPATLRPAIEQLEHARVGVVAAAGVGFPQRRSEPDLHAAAALLVQAKRALTGALERLTLAHGGLERYLIGAIGTPRIAQRPPRGTGHRTRSARVGKQIRAARDTARNAEQDAGRAGKATQRVERRNTKRARKSRSRQPHD